MNGTSDPRFARVRDVFAENFVSHGEVGASVAVTLDGKLVVDPSARIGFGYVPNMLGTEIQLDPRAMRLIDALYASL